MKKLKHSKFRNTGILFELLVRQITLEVINGDTVGVAKQILKEFFNKNTELSKEFRLYDLLLKEKYKTESRAEKFVDLICEERKKINDKKLLREKYELVKKIKESFDLEKFLSSPLLNYRQLASIYKLFEATAVSTTYNVKEKFDAKITLIEHIMSSTTKSKIDKKVDGKLLETFSKQDKDLRLLTYKILVETFNKKYSTALNQKQKALLENFINNITNTTGFVDYYKKELVSNVSKLKKLNEKICDRVTKIKLNETIKVLESTKVNKVVSDEGVSMLMLTYELMKELGDKLNEK
jgi:hypothetical protein